ncbi:MAG: sulfide-dependent adenosine diphosphate thiazole synthase [candidate division WOR-3 bacterium]|nr:sulfide-dependent adenosine diphosphate thiazole synthase [candidate division WOR-3 bacterium]MDW8151221.1 sulfide-dependent adenosine diphosphate thiazole synthase [candidate division WOR-3 bacterium]
MEKLVTKAMLDKFYQDLSEAIYADVFVIGAGPSGLVCARELSKNGLKVFVIEQNNYLGGGFWIGGYYMNTITIREPANKLLDEIGIPYEKVSEGLFISYGPIACSKLIYETAISGTKFLQLTYLDDLVIKHNRVSGVVVNWSPTRALPRAITCVDPIALEGKFVVDASGHDAIAVKKLSQRKLLEIKGLGPLNIEVSEENVIKYTSEVYPGLVVCGMAVAETYGLNRMGPTFGSMLLSGKKASEIILKQLKN